jgi:hypothetical protein
MRKLVGVAVAVALVLTVSGTALAARGGNGGGNGGGGHVGVAPATSSIDFATPGPYAFGGTVYFTTNAVGLNGGSYPMVLVQCFAADGSILYGQLDHPNVGFLLGGGSSPWWLNRVDANCAAELWAYGGSKGEYKLAGPLTFDASAY